MMMTKKIPSKSNYDCIVVLGNSPNPKSEPNPFLKLRLKAGIKYVQNGVSDNLILTGAKKDAMFSEAEIMKKYCVKQGIPEEFITLEEYALSTFENLKNSDMIMKTLSYEDALVVTSNHHIRRTKEYCNILMLENFEVVGSANNFLTAISIIPLTIIEQYKMYKLKKADVKL